MRVYQFIGSFIILGSIIPSVLHYHQYGQFNIYQILCSFFCILNILINIWEISLGLYIKKVHFDYIKLKERFKGNEFGAVVELFLMKVDIFEALSLKFWTRIWSTYSLYDPSYSNKESFGFFIDVGNGWSTLLPSAIFTVGMTYDLLSARVLGLMGLVLFYQV